MRILHGNLKEPVRNRKGSGKQSVSKTGRNAYGCCTDSVRKPPRILSRLAEDLMCSPLSPALCWRQYLFFFYWTAAFSGSLRAPICVLKKNIATFTFCNLVFRSRKSIGNFCVLFLKFSVARHIFLKKYDLYFVNQGCRISNPCCI